MVKVRFLAEKAREVSRRLGLLSTEAKNQILEKIAESLEENFLTIMKANEKDMAAGRKKKLPESLLDRLYLDKKRVWGMAADVRSVAQLKDYVGEVLETRELPNKLFLRRIRVPIGVIGMIYEARPNVTVDAATLCFKSGNAVILKGGSDAMHSNRALIKIIQDVLREMSFTEPEARLQDAIQLLDTEGHSATNEMLKLYGLIDVIIPRGGKSLIDFVRENSKIPVIETGASVVHTYVHEDADIKKAVDIVLNAKLRRVGICNTLDSLLVDKNVAAKFLRALTAALPKNPYHATRLEMRADRESFAILQKLPKLTTSGSAQFKLTVKKSTEKDYATEFLDYILAVKAVRGLNEAMDHIARFSLKHSEAIITEDRAAAERFLQTVDSACVYWNASTQFSDGAQFGLGAEIGISTQKLHARGPFALEGLTSYKWVIEGSGQIRNP